MRTTIEIIRMSKSDSTAPCAVDPGKNDFDYTKWQRQLFPDLSVEELNRKAAEYDRTNRSRSAS